MARSSSLIRSIIAALLLVALVSCGTSSGSDGDGGVVVVATTSMLGDLVRNVVGDDGSVEVLLPLGADPHDFEPSAQQVAAIQEADLVVANGLQLEEGMTDILEAAEADGANVLAVADKLEPIPFAEGTHEDDADHTGEAEESEPEHGDDDPHVWFDPLRMGEAARVVAAELERLEPSVDWATRADQYAAELTDAHAEIQQILAPIPAEDRKLVTNHEVLGYFADRYGFEIIGAVIPGGSTLADPSSAELAALVEEIEHEGVKAIIAETTQPSALADSIASETGVQIEVVEIYTESLGEPGSEADTLIGMLVTNARRIADALS